MINRDSGVPIYIQIQELLEEMLHEGTLKANDLVPSEHELAERLGVSRLTVRKSYSELVKRGIFYTLQGKGTYVKEDYKINQPNIPIVLGQVIGVILPEITDFFAEVFLILKKEIEAAGYCVSLMFNDEVKNEIAAIDAMIYSDVRGVLIAPSRNANTIIEHYQKLIKSTIPVVMIGKAPFKIFADAVYCDDTFAAYRSVEILLEHENKDIAYVTSSSFTDEAERERRAGYFSAIKDYLPHSTPYIVDIDLADFEGSIKDLIFGYSKVTAFFCYCDWAASKVYNIVLKYGKSVPEDIEIIGYDDSQICYYPEQKAFSSVNQRREEMGRRALDLLLKKINQIATPLINDHVVIQPKINLRETTRK